ncbi:MAG: hypothetical protein LC802_23645 [Acidobacteria bacterium]|nr:hypothetical protein [Acidobacteriota bacterium]
MKKLAGIVLLVSLPVAAAACSGGTTTTNTTATTTTPSASPAGHTDAPGASPHNHDALSTGAAGHGGDAANSDAPASVRAALPDAQSITTQHKDISDAQIASIEKETGTKVADKDHHSYLAFSTAGGTRKQIGAATLVKANGKEMVVIYDSRNGVPYIREVRAEGVPQAFLDGFKGKGHDDKFQVGGDLKANGADEAMARAVAAAIRQDAVTMQTLYGGKHSH